MNDDNQTRYQLFGSSQWKWGPFVSPQPCLAFLPFPEPVAIHTIEIDTLEYQQTEKTETEMKDVDRIRIMKVYASCPGWHSRES